MRVALDGSVAGRIGGRCSDNECFGENRGTESCARERMCRVHAARLKRDLREEACLLTEHEERIVEFLLAVHQEERCVAKCSKRNDWRCCTVTGQQSESRAYGMRGRQCEQKPFLEEHIVVKTMLAYGQQRNDAVRLPRLGKLLESVGRVLAQMQ